MFKRVLSVATLIGVCLLANGCNAAAPTWMGANVKVSANAPWESQAAARSLDALAKTGASKALLVAFVWQASPQSNDPVLGSDSSVEAMRAALRQSLQAGLQPTLKVHVWIPGHWAGDAAPTDPAAWFAAYQQALLPLAKLAQDEHAEALVIGTELRKLQDAPQWPALVAAVRKVYHGKLLYVADGIEHAERFGYWSLFDAVGTSLYPRLSEAADARSAEMTAAAQRLQQLGAFGARQSGRAVGKPGAAHGRRRYAPAAAGVAAVAQGTAGAWRGRHCVVVLVYRPQGRRPGRQRLHRAGQAGAAGAGTLRATCEQLRSLHWRGAASAQGRPIPLARMGFWRRPCT